MFRTLFAGLLILSALVSDGSAGLPVKLRGLFPAEDGNNRTFVYDNCRKAALDCGNYGSTTVIRTYCAAYFKAYSIAYSTAYSTAYNTVYSAAYNTAYGIAYNTTYNTAYSTAEQCNLFWKTGEYGCNYLSFDTDIGRTGSMSYRNYNQTTARYANISIIKVKQHFFSISDVSPPYPAGAA